MARTLPETTTVTVAMTDEVRALFDAACAERERLQKQIDELHRASERLLVAIGGEPWKLRVALSSQTVAEMRALGDILARHDTEDAARPGGERGGDSVNDSGRVVHFNDNVPGAVYIGRVMPRVAGSPLANRFKIGRDGTRAEVIAKYRVWLDGLLEDPRIVDALIACRDRPLACWCRHDGEAKTSENACHGDAILDLLARFTDNELRAMSRGG